MVKEFWNERFGQTEFVYGTTPNVYFKSVIDTLPKGKLLVPGAGEGRDAVYAATKGWDVTAFDLSDAGKIKANQLATEHGTSIDYQILDAADFLGEGLQYDAIAIVFFHLPSQLRTKVYPELMKSLKPGGTLILQLFHQSQLGNSSGGPKDVDMLYLTDFATTDFPGLHIEELAVRTVDLDEGSFHSGTAQVVCLCGSKK